MTFDYAAGAELFPVRSSSTRTRVGYMRFGQAAEAIKFAIEVLPSKLLPGTFLQVENDRFGSEEIKRLYENSSYPLARRA